MRLSPEDVAAIKAAAHEAFGDTVVVRLFGSRRFDDLDGGDVDLHVEADPFDDAPQRLESLRSALWTKLRHDKVDVLVSCRGAVPRGFERLAYRDGIIL